MGPRRRLTATCLGLLSFVACTVTVGEGLVPHDITSDAGAACTSDRDCDPQAFCSGLVTCGPDGFCEPASGFAAVTGTPCGNCDGTCNDGGICWLATCGCLSALSDGGTGYMIDSAIGQDCNGPDNSDTAANACRTNCEPPGCGDGVVDQGEKCDLGAVNGKGLGCNATCNLLGEVTTVVGGGPLSGPGAIALCDGLLYVGTQQSRAIVQVDPSTGASFAVAGGNNTCTDQDGIGSAGTFCDMGAIASYDGGLLVGDDGALRFVTCARPATVSTFAGERAIGGVAVPGLGVGPFLMARYDYPAGIATISEIIYSDTETPGVLLQSDPTRLLVSDEEVALNGSPASLAGITAIGKALFIIGNGPSALFEVMPTPPGSGMPLVESLLPGVSALLAPTGMCNDGHSLYICDEEGNDIWQYDLRSQTLTLLAGGQPDEIDGVGVNAGFAAPTGCVFDPDAGVLYVADIDGNTVRRVQ